MMLDHSSDNMPISGKKEFQFYPKHFILFMGLFFLSIIIGTLSHECGHIIVAKFLGYDVKMDYHSMDWMIKGGSPFVKPLSHDIVITLGGVLMTMGISVTAFVFILKHKSIDAYYWLLLFSALFISRQIINLIMSIIGKLCYDSASYFGGDELALSQMLHLHDGFFSIVTAIFSMIICYILVFNLLPRKYFLTFISAAIVGGISGYYIWFSIIGPLILPSID